MQSENKIQVALAFSDDSGQYARHVAAVMASVFTNTKSAVRVHLIHDDTLTEENRSKLLDTARAFNQEAVCINVENRTGDCVLGAKRHASAGAKATYYRLLIPSLFDFDKVIYLDCDIIVNLDIAELWNIPLDGAAIAAVPEMELSEKPESLKGWVRRNLVYSVMMGLDLKNHYYFNAGVLAMNLKKIRENYNFAKLVEYFFAKFRKVIQFEDQDCLNYIFSGDCLYIDPKFNYMGYQSYDTLDLERARGRIWHFACDDKPWSSYSRPGIDNLYWKYLAMTPYCGNADELIALLLDGMSGSKYYHPHSSDCSGRLKKKLAGSITRGHLLNYPRVFWSLCKAVLSGKTARRGAADAFVQEECCENH